MCGRICRVSTSLPICNDTQHVLDVVLPSFLQCDNVDVCIYVFLYEWWMFSRYLPVSDFECDVMTLCSSIAHKVRKAIHILLSCSKGAVPEPQAMRTVLVSIAFLHNRMMFFPHKYIQSFTPVVDGKHEMILTKAKYISKTRFMRVAVNMTW